MASLFSGLSLKAWADIAFGLMIVAFLAWVFHEGEARIEAANAKAAAAQVIHNDEVQKQAAASIADIQQKYATMFAAPPVAPIHVSVCKPTRTQAMPQVGGAPASTDGAADVQAAVGQPRDIGPDTDHILDQADAQIAALQAVIQAYRQETGDAK